MTKAFIKRILIAVVLLTALLSCVALGVTGAKFHTNILGKGQVPTAVFAFDVADASGNFNLDISSLTKPNTKVEYSFSVSNKQSAVSQVAQVVTLKIDTTGELPFVITVKEGESTLLTLDMTSQSTATQQIANFVANTEQSKTFTVVVEWPSDRASLEYGGKTAQVFLEVTAEQKA